ncbi:NAD-dependent epimerase/dehydratase family protein [Anaerosporobacter sp.]|uniref:NAD-dependent epimerase/dehydratase family protein n=1 Tax=Anaerosporobacter sp. TaxID=1872529 RepID=UPI00286ED59B|nr:NAD-dependent epimerase/dehydratase family protein [Anaerosporobacter sp.]
MKKVLMIGANSYIGNAFERYINDKYIDNKYINDNTNTSESTITIDKVQASNGDWKHVNYEGYDVVLILAAIVHQKEKNSMKELYQSINCDMPVEIAKKAKAAGVKQLIFMSTAAVYGSSVTRITRYTKELPDTLYGKSKLEAEIKLKVMETEDFHIAIIRPPMVYGEGCKGNYTRLVKLATYNPIYPKIHNKRSMIQIDMLCSFLEEVIENTGCGTYLPQDEEYADTIMTIKRIRTIQGKKTIIVPGTAWLVRIAMKCIGAVRKMFGDWWYE